MRNPGTAPLQWEHKLGKPKDERKQDVQAFVELYILSQSFLLGEFVEKLKLELIMWRMQRAIVLGMMMMIVMILIVMQLRCFQDLSLSSSTVVRSVVMGY